VGRQKQLTPEQVKEALERFLQRHGSEPISPEALQAGLLSDVFGAVAQTGPEDTASEGEVTQVDRSVEEEIDLEAMVSDALSSSVIESVQLEDISEADSRTADASRERGPAQGSGAMGSGGGHERSASGGSGVRSATGTPSGGNPSSSGIGGGVAPGPALDPELAPPDDVVPTRWGRYRVLGELNRGGQGRILHAVDDFIGRPIALKVLLRKGLSDARQVRKFYDEAQITGQLEHPIIIPVHELGRLENGLPYYTMKKIEGRTLKNVIVGLRKKNPLLRLQYGPVRLISILLQVCQAVAYAHDRGVIHRDLKPSNIMLGSYGEVTVLDWGVARLRPDAAKKAREKGLSVVKLVRHGSPEDTLVGAIEGTPAYMAPEQARGRNDEIDERTDVYALGAILYEILTYRPPFRGDVKEVLRRVPIEMPVRPSIMAPQNQVPEELEQICMRCLAKNPDERFQSVKDLQQELEAYLEGTKRREEAQKKIVEAQELVKQHQQLQQDLLMAKNVARRAGHGIQGWEPIERKRGVWATWDRVAEIEAKILTTFGEAVARFSQALAHDPSNRDAREGLADLFVSQYRKAIREGDRSEAIYCESMVRQYTVKRYAAFLKGEGTLSVSSQPAGAEVWFYRYEERDRVLRPVDARMLGYTPVEEVALPQGSYLIVLRAAGYRDVYYPVKLERQETCRAAIKMRTHAEIGDGFVYVPESEVFLGGDREAIDGYPKEKKLVASFAIQEFPVTFRKYIEFLNAWLEVDPAEAERLKPRLDEGLPLVVLGPNGYEPIPDLIGPEGRALGRPGMAYDVPIFGVEFEFAEAYCAWQSEISGMEFRLPTEVEWEKAGRGADERVFPWGNQFDPTFCKSRLSRPWAPEPEPIKSFPEDISPYGVRDMAGGVREWCDDWYNESQGLRVLKGGAWVDTDRYMRCASRSFLDPVLSKGVAGFRCARTLA